MLVGVIVFDQVLARFLLRGITDFVHLQIATLHVCDKRPMVILTSMFASLLSFEVCSTFAVASIGKICCWTFQRLSKDP